MTLPEAIFYGLIVGGILFGILYFAKSEDRKDRIDALEIAFKKSFCEGRIWLSDFIAEAWKSVDDAKQEVLMVKSRPARKASEQIAKTNQEKRALVSKIKFLEYQLKSYEEYFPWLEDYRDVILNEEIDFSRQMGSFEEVDPVRIYLSAEEYNSLSPCERNQQALNSYCSSRKSSAEAGRMYERYVGFLYESSGWNVEFHGAVKGLSDFGRDLICRNGKVVHLVQCKRWHTSKIIREKHLFQLFGTKVLFEKDSDCPVYSVFYATTSLSPEAEMVSSRLNIKFIRMDMPEYWPMIKCNIGRSGERIYHLPFDQQYDRVIIGNQSGECYATTCEDAEIRGFRRAWRHSGIKNQRISTFGPSSVASA